MAQGPWFLAGAGIVLFHLAWQFQGDERGYWLPGLGLGMALCSWLGWRILPVLAIDLLFVRIWTDAYSGPMIVVADGSINERALAKWFRQTSRKS